MKSTREYFNIGDNCDDCRYIANAFRLLNLNLTTLSPENVNTIPSHANCIIFCPKQSHDLHKKTLKALTDPNQTLFIFLNQDPISKQNHISLKTPFCLNELLQALSTCPGDQFYLSENEILNQLFAKLVGNSKKIRDTKELILKVADTDATVLVLGPSGSGKEIVASCIHQLSSRRDNPFVPLNCGAIPSELMESELFGHEKGAFTGATTRRPGRFELANTGTLFLDEIGDMPMPMQVKLLRVIQDKKIDRVGSNHSIDINLRLIAATNKNLPLEIKNGNFREDLYYRLNVFPIIVPSLKERAEDIPQIIEFLLTNIQKRVHHRVAFTDHALDMLCHYPWPGNIRELENFLERNVILHTDKVLDINDISIHYRTPASSLAEAVF